MPSYLINKVWSDSTFTDPILTQITKYYLICYSKVNEANSKVEGLEAELRKFREERAAKASSDEVTKENAELKSRDARMAVQWDNAPSFWQHFAT